MKHQVAKIRGLENLSFYKNSISWKKEFDLENRELELDKIKWKWRRRILKKNKDIGGPWWLVISYKFQGVLILFYLWKFTGFFVCLFVWIYLYCCKMKQRLRLRLFTSNFRIVNSISFFFKLINSISFFIKLIISNLKPFRKSENNIYI